MRPERQTDAKTWLVTGPASALARLEPLISAQRLNLPVRVLESPCSIVSYLGDAACVLVIGLARRSPATSLPGVFLRARDGRCVPAGWLPDVGDRLEGYARAAAKVQARCTGNPILGPFVLLGELDPRALDTVERVAAEMPREAAVFRWTSERLRRSDLMRALRCGPGAAFYFGHATAGGWAGYAGFDKTNAALASGSPLGAIFSLSCSVASRPRRGLSFCEELVLSGLCAAAFGAARRTLHRRNVDLGTALARALSSGSVMTLADLLIAANISTEALSRYRILGDPLAPLIGDPESLGHARAVFAPAPGDALPIVALSDWTGAHPQINPRTGA